MISSASDHIRPGEIKILTRSSASYHIKPWKIKILTISTASYDIRHWKVNILIYIDRLFLPEINENRHQTCEILLSSSTSFVSAILTLRQRSHIVKR